MSWENRKEIEEWLLAHRIVDESGCWLWTRGCETGGYGNQTVSGEVYRLNRLSAHLWLGFDLNSPLVILHSCDVPLCFNPGHLKPGTALENVLDSAQKQRRRKKLFAEDVHAIRHLLVKYELSKSAIARQFGVGCPTVLAIERRETWSHLISDEMPVVKKRTDRVIRGEDMRTAKLTNADVVRMRELRKAGTPIKELAALFKVSQPTVSTICSGKTWTHIPCPDIPKFAGNQICGEKHPRAKITESRVVNAAVERRARRISYGTTTRKR